MSRRTADTRTLGAPEGGAESTGADAWHHGDRGSVLRGAGVSCDRPHRWRP